MKGLKLSKPAALSAGLLLVFLSAIALADEAPKKRMSVNMDKTTAHGYNPMGFCQQGAETLINQLSKPNKARDEKIDELRKEILSLSQQRQIITEMNNLSKKYKESLVNLEKLSKAEQEKGEVAIDSMKTALRNGLTLNAISLLLKDTQGEDWTKAETFTMAHLCQKNPTEEICKKIIEEDRPTTGFLDAATKMLSRTFNGTSEYRKLDRTLASFHEAFSRVEPEDQKSLIPEVQKIIDDIPADIKPSAIVSLIQSKAPQTSAILAQDLPRETVINCLSEEKPYTEGICKGLATDKEKREQLIEVVSAEKEATQRAVSDKAAPVLKAIAEVQNASAREAVEAVATAEISKLQTLAQKVGTLGVSLTQANVRENRSPASVGTCQEAKSKLSGVALLFFDCPRLSGLSAVDAEKALESAQQDARSNSESLVKNCQELNANTSSSIISSCKSLLGKIVSRIDLMNNDYDSKIAYLQNEVKKLSSDADQNAIERLKEYVVNKYLDTCSPDTKKMVVNDVSLSVCHNGESTNAGLYRIDGLFKDTQVIVKQLRPSSISLGEMQEFQNSCNSLSRAREEVKNASVEVCSFINKDYASANKKEEIVQREKKESEDYWIDYDPHSRGNISKTKKKSTLRVIGEGVLPIAPSLIPMWFNNYQAKQGIEMLTNQGIYQKQLLHTIDVYNSSPWMYGYNYFMYNPYSFGSTTSTGTSGTNPGFSF